MGTDGSQHSEAAVQKAFSFARILKRPVVAVFVVDSNAFQTFPPEALVAELSDVMRKEATSVLESIKDRGREQGVTVETQVREGRPADELCSVATERDIIVIATHGRRGLGRILLGSVAENVIRHAPCPVLVIRRKR